MHARVAARSHPAFHSRRRDVVPNQEIQRVHHLRIRGAGPDWAVFLFSGISECAAEPLATAVKGISTWLKCVRSPISGCLYCVFGCTIVRRSSCLVFYFDFIASEVLWLSASDVRVSPTPIHIRVDISPLGRNCFTPALILFLIQSSPQVSQPLGIHSLPLSTFRLQG